MASRSRACRPRLRQVQPVARRSRPCPSRSRARSRASGRATRASSSAEAVVEIDHGVLQAGPVKQPRLGRAVALHGAVVVEVVARKIGEQRGRRRLDAVHPALVEAVGGDFHRDTVRACAQRDPRAAPAATTASGVVWVAASSSPGKPLPSVPITAVRRVRARQATARSSGSTRSCRWCRSRPHPQLRATDRRRRARRCAPSCARRSRHRKVRHAPGGSQ